MVADGPSRGRMGFGFQQAAKAGAPYIAPPSEGQMNLDLFLRGRPHLFGRVEAEARSGKSAAAILFDLREQGYEGDFYIGLYRRDDDDHPTHERYSGDEIALRKEAEWGVTTRVYAYACLMRLDREAGEWLDVCCWPKSSDEGREA